LVWVAGFLFVLGLVVIILGGQVNRLLSERRLEQEIYRALEERRLISPPNDNALELYRRLRREFPNSATFQRVQAKVLNVLRDEINRGFDNFYRTSREDSQMWQELKKLCDWAVDIAPYDNWLKARQRYCYGRLEFLSKRYDNAILAYKEAIQNDPNWALPYESIKNIQIQQQISQINLEKKLLENIIYRWKEAWENKDIEKYMSFYSLNFQGVIYSDVRKLLNYYEWMDYKKRLFDKYNFIKINIKNLNIVISKDYAKVSFYQEFRSDKYSDKGRKILMLRKENNKWKIIKEDFIKYSD
jgi:tetratricopeptide (TPR) repeat protein